MHIQRIFSLLLSAITLLSCETVVDIDLPVEPTRLVVNGFINPDSAVAVRISKSRFVLDRSQAFTLVDDAIVTLFENGLEVTQLTTEGEGWYTSSFRPQAGSEYIIQASASGLEPVEANTEVLPIVVIKALTADSVRRETGTSCFNDDCQPIYSTDYRVQLSLSDPVNQDNFYEVQAYTVVVDSFPVFDDNSDEPTGYDVITYWGEAYLTSDDPVVSSTEFDFGDGAFFGSSLLFTDEIFSGNEYTLNFTSEGSFGGNITRLIIVLRTLSNDQYQYLRTLQLQEYNEGDPFAEVVPVYNNIENGFGIFAGYSADSVVVDID